MESILQRIIKRTHIIIIKLLKKNDDKNIFSHTQKTLILLKMWNSKTLKIQRMFQNCFRISKIQKSFATYKWVIIYMVYEEKL
jgi:hypothetical protein